MSYAGHARWAPVGAFLIGLFWLLLMPHAVHAADLTFSPTTASFPVGQEFSIKVMVEPGTTSVNAADGIVAFDKDVVQVVGVSKDGSAFSLWTAEPAFSNSAGTVTFSGGSPTPFTKTSSVITIRMKGKAVGSAKASFTKGSVLAADGKGTDVFGKGGEASLMFTEAVAAAEEPASEELAPGPVPLAPEITSSTHGKSDQWYGTSTIILTWKLQPDVVGARILLSEKEDDVPTQVQKGAATTTTYTGISDGVKYFLVQLKNDSGWGETGKKKIQIDTVPPKEFEIAMLEAEDGGVPKFSFKAEDELSGVDRYDILAGGNLLASPRAQDVASGSFPVPPQEGGDQSVTIKAYDKAGNVREVTRQFKLPKVEKPSAKGVEDAPPPAPIFTFERIISILLAIVTGVILTRNYQAKKAVAAERSKLLHRVSEVADKNDRIFSAMREEFEQMIQDFDEKPQLTPAERDFLENVKEVLDVSEELVGAGVEELKKQIRGQ